MGNLVSNEKEIIEIVNDLKNKKKDDLDELIFGLIIFDKKIKKLEKIDKDDSILFTKMVIYTFTNEIPQAIEIGEKLKVKHRFIHIYILQARCYIRQGLIDNAENCLKQALEIKPQRLGTLLSLYEINMKKEDYQNAIKYINEIKKFITLPGLDYLLGVAYQKMNQHEEALLCFEQAHQFLQKKRFFMSKMESYLALKKYNEAYECCLIAIIYEPGDKELNEILKIFEEIFGIDEVQSRIIRIGEQQNLNYTIETYKEKRELEATQTKLIMRQSKIKFKQIQGQINQTQSQIKLNKQNQQIIYYLDAIYFTFTYFFALYNNMDQNYYSTKIATYLSTKQKIELLNFTDMIRDTIQRCYPDIKDLNTGDISNKLQLWYNKKIKENGDDIFKYLYDIFFNLQETNLKQQLIERLNEDFSQSIERKKKNQEFYLYLTEICREVEKQGFTIYKESGGLIGLEHAIIILGFMIKFTELVDDQDSFDSFLFRGLDKKDFNQFFQSQSRIKIQTQQPKQQQSLVEEQLISLSLNDCFKSKFL